MDVFFAIINVGFLLFVAFRLWRKEPATLKPFFWPGLIVKCLAGMGLGALYKYHYGLGDTLAYFSDGTHLAALARTDPATYLRFLWSGDESFPVWNNLNLQEPRALFMAKITSIANLFTHDNYWVTSLYFSSVVFFSAWLFVKAVVQMHAASRNAAVFALLFFPSAVFWSAGLIKEGIAMACLFYITVIFLKLWQRQRVAWWQGVVTGVCLWLGWGLKYYYLAIYFPVISSALVAQFLFSRLQVSVAVKGMLWAVIFVIPLYVATLIHPNFYPERFLEVIVSNYEAFHSISQPEDVVEYPGLQATASSMVMNAPRALVAGLFRPFPWEASNVLQAVLAWENVGLLILAAFALTNLRKGLTSPHRMLLVSILLYTVLLCVFLALSTPNYGTLARYRVGFLPFFVLLISIENPVVNQAARFIERSWARLVR
jgi:hypothetical protein